MLLSSPLPLSTSFWWRFVDRICWFVFICEKWIANLVGCCNVWERFVRLRIGCHKSVKCNLGIYRWRFHSICTVLMCVCVCLCTMYTGTLCQTPKNYRRRRRRPPATWNAIEQTKTTDSYFVEALAFDWRRQFDTIVWMWERPRRAVELRSAQTLNEAICGKLKLMRINERQ